MPPYPMPPDEQERLAALDRCGVLDSAPERLFDDIAQLASQLCATPIALVSLVDRSRQWFKARVGLAQSETPRGSSLCAHAILAKRPMVVPDALADPRFAENALVTGEPHIRFYASAPIIVADGYALGTVCVMDHVPRQLTAAQVASLEMLARRTSAELSLRTRLSAVTSAQSAQRVRSSDEQEQDLTQSSDATSPCPSRRAAMLPVPPGAVVGERYRIEFMVGAGGMGVVAAALDLRRAVRVAVKFMRPSALARPPALRRFAREAQVLFTLDSEHVAKVLDFGRLADGSPFIVMEYLEGTDLAARLSRDGRLPVAESIEIVLSACTAVQSAHEQGIFHRDLKPANLFLTSVAGERPALKVLDFGISKLAASEDCQLDTVLTGEATELGSPTYMAPEQMLDAGDADARSDVWSLGIVLYELLAGRPPFTGPNRIEVCANVLTAPLPSLAEQRPEVPPTLVALVERCLAKQPDSRYQSAAELARALHALPQLASTASDR